MGGCRFGLHLAVRGSGRSPGATVRQDHGDAADARGLGDGGRIIERVVGRLGPVDRFSGLKNIGVDELSYRRHHECLMIVSDEDTGRVVWAAFGKDADTLLRFFAELGAGEDRKDRDDYDGHVHRLQVWPVMPRSSLTGFTYSAWRMTRSTRCVANNGWNLAQPKSRSSPACNGPTSRSTAPLLKETLADILDRRQVNVARTKLGEWLAWAARSRKLARTARRRTPKT